MSEPLISIVIPHFNGKEILHACLKALNKTTYANKEVIVVNNASTDDSLENITEVYKGLRLVNNKRNLGYAGGCNSGLEKARGDYVLFLNNDTTFEGDWLAKMLVACEQDAKIAACQPKILSLPEPGKFDYAGAAGGLIDRFGYPFARGRIFFTLETDENQYDTGGEIFWASGTALMVKKSVLSEVGNFDEDFFAHMEEIDLNWRMHLAGYQVVAAPAAVVFHNAGSTLKPDSPRKIFLNHRNSLLMMLKNYAGRNLCWILPIRLFFEVVTIFYSLLKFDFIRLKAVLFSFIQVLVWSPKIMMKRKQVQKIRNVADSEVFKKMYRGSIVLDYFVRGVRRVSDLKNII